MTDTFDPSTSEDNTPIDAEFEPAGPTRSSPDVANRLHWLITLIVAATAIIALGSALLDFKLLQKRDPSSETIAALQSDISELTTQLDQAQADRARLSNQLRTMQTDATAQAQETEALSTRTDAAFRSLSNIEDQLDRLEQSILTLQSQPAGNSDEPIVQVPDPLILERLDALESTLNASPVETGMTGNMPSPLVAEIATLRNEVETLKEQLNAPAPEQPEPEATAKTDWVGAALAITALENASRNGQPFMPAFEQMATALPDHSALPALAPIATSGAPTLFTLKNQFPDLQRRALDTEANAKGGTASWMRAIFGDGITVQRAGKVGAEAALNSAQSALDTGDLSAAITAIESLDPHVQSIFTDWLDNARNRQTLDQALNNLRLTMLAKDQP